MQSPSEHEVAAAQEHALRNSTAIRIFRPYKAQEPIFEQPRPKFMLVDGGNRSGVTLATMALTAAFAMDESITFEDGSSRPARMPSQQGRPVHIKIISPDMLHTGDAIWPLLFEKGAFKAVIDPQTLQLRMARPTGDKQLASTQPPPLIPSRFIKRVEWECKADKVPIEIDVAHPVTGEELATITVASSKMPPRVHSQVDLCVIIDHPYREDVVTEAVAGSIDNDNQFVWGYSGDYAGKCKWWMEQLSERAREGKNGCKKVVLTLQGNPHISQQQVDRLLNVWTPEEAAKRNNGPIEVKA